MVGKLRETISELEEELGMKEKCPVVIEQREVAGIIIKLVSRAGYGFIQTRDEDLYFHASAILGIDFEDLRLGMRVKCIRVRDLTRPSDKGTQAIGVRVIE